MKKLSVPIPRKLETTLQTVANESLLLDADRDKIISKCRQFDAELKMLRNQLNTIIVDHIDDASLIKHINTILLISGQINQIKKYYNELFRNAILNKRNRNWLHLEMSIRNSNGHPDFVLSEDQIRWRVGTSIERRVYCDTHMINNPAFYDFLIQEPIEIQKIILEFERVKMLIWALSYSVRSRYFEICYLYKNYQPIKQLQSYYHSLKGINNGQSI